MMPFLSQSISFSHFDLLKIYKRKNLKVDPKVFFKVFIGKIYLSVLRIMLLAIDRAAGAVFFTIKFCPFGTRYHAI